MPPQVMAPLLAREISALDPGLAHYAVITMQEQVGPLDLISEGRCRLALRAGRTGVAPCHRRALWRVSYAVSQSRRELGLRMALGADPANLLWHVMSRGLAMTAGGVLLGASASFGLARLVAGLLYQVSPHDPLAFGAAFVIMIFASMAACFFPAWRASQSDPMVALRYE